MPAKDIRMRDKLDQWVVDRTVRLEVQRSIFGSKKKLVVSLLYCFCNVLSPILTVIL